jgi:hypothetical protein
MILRTTPQRELPAPGSDEEQADIRRSLAADVERIIAQRPGPRWG